jgi:predicted MFS family arabinose efflux permease
MIARFGWRLSYVSLAALVLLLGLPTSRWLLADPVAAPANDVSPLAHPNARVDHASPISEGVTLREALRSRTFWWLAFGLLFISTAVAAGTVHLPALLADRGVPPTRAAFIMSVVGVSMIVGRIVVGALIDRAFAPHVSALVFLAPLVGHALLTGTGAGLNAIVAAAMFGLGLGAELDVFPYMTSRAFGVRHFGQIYGAMLVAFTSGLAIGAAIVGALYGKHGNYDQALWIAGACAVISAASMLFLRRSDFPYQQKAH